MSEAIYKIYPIIDKVKRYEGKGGWFFILMKLEHSNEIKHSFSHLGSSCGWLKVWARIGETRWRASIFPDKKSGCYFLPLKAEIRKAENIKLNDEIIAQVEVEQI